MPRRLLWMVPVFITAGFLFAAFPARADQAAEPTRAIPSGSGLFSTYCAVCHGTDAKGTGPLADTLKRRPADLTMLARNNKGTFDGEMIRRVIDGRVPVKGHGGGDMPVWGDAFERSVDAGPAAVKDRLDALVTYLATLQMK